MKNEIEPKDDPVCDPSPVRAGPLLTIEVIELADLSDSTADVVFYRSTCTTCSTS